MKVLPISMFPTLEESKLLAIKEGRDYKKDKNKLSPLALLVLASKSVKNG